MTDVLPPSIVEASLKKTLQGLAVHSLGIYCSLCKHSWPWFSFVYLSSLHADEPGAESKQLLLCQCHLDSKQQSCHLHRERCGGWWRTHLHHRWQQLWHHRPSLWLRLWGQRHSGQRRRPEFTQLHRLAGNRWAVENELRINQHC